MGQLDNGGQDAGTNKLNLGNIQFHETSRDIPAPAHSGARLDFSSIINSGTAGTAERTVSPAPVQARPVDNNPGTIYVPVIDHRAAAPAPRQIVAGPARVQSVAAESEPAPPHPADSPSIGEQMQGLVTNGAVIGSSVLVGMKLRDRVKADEISRTQQLGEVTKPETLTAVRKQADEVTRLVAGKSREANAAVEKIVGDKPDAFQEITETMPAKGPGKAPETLVFHQPKPMRALTEQELALPEDQLSVLKGKLSLTEEEMAASDRAEYLRSMEKVLVKDFNMNNTTTVAAFRTRAPYLQGLGKTEAAAAEGLTEPLDKLQVWSDRLMAETTEGRLALHSEARGTLLKGAAVLGGSYLATRGIDSLLYSKPQGMMTTAFDCAAPLLVLTKMNPLLKAGIMIGGHELVRVIENSQAAHRDD